MDNSIIRRQIELAGYSFAKDFYNQWREEKDCFVEDDQGEIWYKESSDENGNILKDVFEDIIYDRCCDVFYCMDAYSAFCDSYELDIPDDFLREVGGFNKVSDMVCEGIDKFIEDTYHD